MFILANRYSILTAILVVIQGAVTINGEFEVSGAQSQIYKNNFF